MEKSGTFEVGDLVFAKLKGYRPWPAKIIKLVSSKKYGVYFYGTGQIANVKIENLFNYVDNKAKFAKDEQFKMNNYRKAIEEIEAALQRNDPAPLNITDISKQYVLFTSEIDTENNDENKSQVNESVDDVNATISDASTAIDDKNEELILNYQKSSLTSTKKNDYQDVSETSTPIMTTTNEEGDKLVSRSGRKIILKRYLNEEEEEERRMKKKLTTDSESEIKSQKNEEKLYFENNAYEHGTCMVLKTLTENENEHDSKENDDGVIFTTDVTFFD